MVYNRHASFFPAHLHIDVLPGYQRMGAGTMLMDTLIAHLTEKKSKGVMAFCEKKNKKAMSFYKKYGFEILGKEASGFTFGYDLDSKIL